MRLISLLAFVLLSSCATASATNGWALLEGCWIDRSDAIPAAQMTWARDPNSPGALIGTWRAPDNDGDDVVIFKLTPDGDHMRLCEQDAGVAERCTRAVLATRWTPPNGYAAFEIDAHDLTFGYVGGAAAFYIGRRGECS